MQTNELKNAGCIAVAGVGRAGVAGDLTLSKVNQCLGGGLQRATREG